jgi:hypothetical protein
MQIQDFKAGVTLPYSKSCFQVYALSGKEIEIERLGCDALKARSLFVTSEDWKIIRKNFQTNCQLLQCQQLVGQFDQLFIIIDQNLQKVNF